MEKKKIMKKVEMSKNKLSSMINNRVDFVLRFFFTFVIKPSIIS